MPVPPHRTDGVNPWNVPAEEPRATEADFQWPPRAEDLAACSIVPLSDDVLTVPDWGVDVPEVTAPPVAEPRPKPAPRRWTVEKTEGYFPFSPEANEPVGDPWSRGEIARAAAALFVGVSLALVSYPQFRDSRLASAVPAVVLEQVARAASSLDLPTPALAPPPRPYVGHEGLALLRGTSMSERPAAVPAARPPAPAKPAATPVSVAVPADVVSARVVAEYVAPQPADEGRAHLRAVPAPVPAPPVVVSEVAGAPIAEPIATTARVDPSRDEEHIRTTLTQWRTAYSHLDANAARAVWPSVDVRALERAFQSVKSQELSFDHCDFTVNGARAQAACTGRASYVPRVGNPSPKTNAREWKFELTRSDERWTIAPATASARSELVPQISPTVRRRNRARSA